MQLLVVVVVVLVVALLLLEAEQFEISTVLILHQRRMAPLLDNLPILQHGYHVRALDGGQPVSHHDGGPPLHDPVERLLDHPLRLDVEGAGGLVEQQDGRVFDDGSSDGHALLLAAGELHPSLADLGRVPFRERADEGVGVGELGRLDDLRLRRAVLPVDDVVVNGGGEEDGFLLD